MDEKKKHERAPTGQDKKRPDKIVYVKSTGNTTATIAHILE